MEPLFRDRTRWFRTKKNMFEPYIRVLATILCFIDFLYSATVAALR